MNRTSQKLALSLFMIAGAAKMLAACGIYINHKDDKPNSGTQNYPLTSSPEPVSSAHEDGSKTFQGYVGGAFEVNVDGTAYSDMEDFYTKEMRRIPEKVQKAGYDASWTAKFEAEVGLSDLWNNMTVYVSPVDGAGFQAQTRVGDSGGFALTLPAQALEHDYKVRANKRIDILLTRGDTQLKICYNFSAVEHSVPFHHDSLPIVIDTFVTTITDYECSLADGDGVNIPHAPTPTTAPAKTLAVGQSKSDVVKILGLEGLAAQSTTQWCWSYRAQPDSPCAKKKDNTSCDCQVTFDAQGLASAFDGFADTYTKAP